MKVILTILVLLLVSAGAFAPTGGGGEAWAGDLPEGAIEAPEPGKTDGLVQEGSGDPTDANDNDDDDGPLDDDLPPELKLAGATILDGMYDLLTVMLTLLP